jgi:hypothetical protein
MSRGAHNISQFLAPSSARMAQHRRKLPGSKPRPPASLNRDPARPPVDEASA